MKCPKCSQGEVKEQISLKGFWFWKRKEVVSFCPLCDFSNLHTFSISKDDKKVELADRESNVGLKRIETLNTRTNREEIKSNKKYNQIVKV